MFNLTLNRSPKIELPHTLLMSFLAIFVVAVQEHMNGEHSLCLLYMCVFSAAISPVLWLPRGQSQECWQGVASYAPNYSWCRAVLLDAVHLQLIFANFVAIKRLPSNFWNIFYPPPPLVWKMSSLKLISSSLWRPIHLFIFYMGDSMSKVQEKR